MFLGGRNETKNSQIELVSMAANVPFSIIDSHEKSIYHLEKRNLVFNLTGTDYPEICTRKHILRKKTSGFTRGVTTNKNTWSKYLI